MYACIFFFADAGQQQERFSPPTRSVRDWGVVIVSAPPPTQTIMSTCFSYWLLLQLRRSMKLTEMYEHIAWQNERPRRTFFIITRNDYEFNFLGGWAKKKKNGV